MGDASKSRVTFKMDVPSKSDELRASPIIFLDSAIALTAVRSTWISVLVLFNGSMVGVTDFTATNSDMKMVVEKQNMLREKV